MNEQQVREIARQEAKKIQWQNFMSGNPQIPPHIHDGGDNIKISQKDILPSTRVTGNITFKQKTEYRIGVTFNPTFIFFHGELVDNPDSPVARFHLIGTAQLGPSYNLQPLDTTTVTTAGLLQNITQSSSYFGLDASGGPHVLTDEFHIIDVEYPKGTIHARMTVKSFNKQYVTVSVDNLDSGWAIIGNFVIS